MSLAVMPSNRLNLHGFATQYDAHTPAVLFKLSDSLLEDVKNVPKAQGGLQLLTGSTPRIRLGKRTIDLTLSAEAFRHELYSASADALGDFNFAAVLHYRAELKVSERKQSAGGDAALAVLQNSMASIQREKEAKSVNISDQVVKEPKNRWEAAKSARRRVGLGIQVHESASGSSPGNDHANLANLPPSEAAERSRAMRTPLVHLLAMRPNTREEIVRETHIPKDEAEEVLQRIGTHDGGKWKLIDRAYKELDVWKFAYRTQSDRQAAIDNAIRAYDRLRLGKDERLWQMLLPREQRDKGIVLSKLHLAPTAPGRTMTPNPAGSGDEAVDVKSTVNTPRLGPAGTPKIGSGKNDGVALSKRLFSKDPKKARAAEEAKEKKRKDREAAAAANSDREGGVGGRTAPRKVTKSTVKTSNKPKVKSEEIVRDSSDDSDGGPPQQQQRVAKSSQPKPATNRRRLQSPTTNGMTSSTLKQKTASETPLATDRSKPTSAARSATTSTPSARLTGITHSSTTSRPAALAGKSTPNGLSATSVHSNRSQRSPRKDGTRPTAPSPLGAARPRVASDVSDRGAMGVQRGRQGGDTPKTNPIPSALRKRHDTVTSTDSGAGRGNATHKMNGSHGTSNPAKLASNGNSTSKSTFNDPADKEARGVKRKNADSPSQQPEHTPVLKHRKTESLSSQSQKSQLSSVGAGSSTDVRLHRSNSSDSTSSLMRDITFSQGVDEARRFRDIYYPQYAAEYDKQLAMEKRGEKVSREARERLWSMHRRIEQMKQEIRIASEKEHSEET